MRPAFVRSIVLITLAALVGALVSTRTGEAQPPQPAPSAPDALGFQSALGRSLSGPTTNLSNGITFDHATLNDPIRMVGEPDIAIDHVGGTYVSGPGGSTTQASWFWKSEDGGVQWHLVGCPGKSNCQNGGGDTEITIANNNDVFASDLQTLQCNSTFRSYDQGKTWLPGEGCFPETDRQWMAVYDPNGSATGRRIYLSANELALGCYLLVSTDNGVTYLPADPKPADAALIDPDGGRGCEGRLAVDPADGTIYSPMDDGSIFRSTNGGMSFSRVGASGGQGHFFASLFLDTRGNVYQAWVDDPNQAANHAYISVSTDRGVTWTTKQVSTGPGSPVGTSPDLRQLVFPWGVAGDPGRVAVTYYGTTDAQKDTSVPAYGGVNALWHVYTSFSTNLVNCALTCAVNPSPTFTQVQTTEHVNHRGAICLGGFPGCLTANSDRSMADFFMIDKDPDGRAFVAYNENSDLSNVTVAPNVSEYIGKPIVATIRLRTGPSLFASQGNLLPTPTPANVAITNTSLSGGTLTVTGTQGLPPGNWTTDPSGDAPFPVVPVTSANHPALDILESSVGDDGTTLTFKLKLADLSAAALADAATTGGTPAWMVMWWEGKGGIGPANMTSGPFHSHWFVKWLGGTNFVYGRVGSIDAPALGAPTPKFLTYTPSGTATGSVSGNDVTISVPIASLGGVTAGDKLDHITAYTLAEHSDVTLTDVVDQAKSYSYVLGTPASRQHTADGYVEVSLSPDFTNAVLATLNPSSNAWTATITGAPSGGTVYARQVLAKDLYTPVWDDVQAGPVAQRSYGPTAVGVQAFAARRIGGTVVLRWRTASEAQTLGFDVYRGRVKLNAKLIASRGGTRGHVYVWRDRSPGSAARYTLVEVRRDGTRVRHGPVVVR
jgi:hypothetical protein